MARAAGYHAKKRMASSLLAKADFLMLAETHSTVAASTTYTEIPGTLSWWSAGTAQRAGVGIIVRSSFLNRFGSHPPEWQEIAPGRLAKLTLRGPEGSLQILTGYMPTGTRRQLHPTEEDPASALSLRRQRQLLSGKIKDALKDDILTILAADFNFVTSNEDRLSTTTGGFTGGGDAAEYQHWCSLLPPSRLHEFHQPELTHTGPISTARLDRMYCSQHMVEQLDRRLYSTALQWTSLSQHRPIAFGRVAARSRQLSGAPISEETIADPRWPVAAAMELQELTKIIPNSDLPMVKLRLAKAAMRSAADLLTLEQQAKTDAEVLSPLSAAMRTLRLLEKRGPAFIHQALDLYPHLCPLLPQNFLNKDPGWQHSTLQNLAVELAKKNAMRDLTELHECKDGLPESVISRKRGSLLRQLSRLSPGKGVSVVACSTSDGSITTDEEEIIAALREHWATPFSSRPIDKKLLDKWLEDDSTNPGV